MSRLFRPQLLENLRFEGPLRSVRLSAESERWPCGRWPRAPSEKLNAEDSASRQPAPRPPRFGNGPGGRAKKRHSGR